MSMMYVWVVVMAMHHSFMTMRMAVGLAQWRELIMLVLMVFVVNVSMIVLNHFMLMLVRMSLSQVQPNTDSHQSSSNHKLIG
jgi:heme/copper-type cytochrome/quinol oxidase subunit 2